MSAPDDAELDAELADYLAAFRAEEAPAAATVDANWHAIASQTRPQRGIWLGVALAAAAAVLLLVWGPWRGSSAKTDDDGPGQLAPYEHEGKQVRTTAAAAEDEAPPPRSKVRGTPAPAGDVAAETWDEPQTVPEPEAPPAETADTAGPERPAPPRARTSRDRPRTEPTPPQPAGPSALSRETKLLGEIKAALDSGSAAKALELAKVHARDFPKGAFANERQVARARALCALGRKDSARKLADRFVAAHPKSHLVDQMAAICRGTSTDEDAKK